MNRLFIVLLFVFISLSGFGQSKWGYGLIFSPDAVSETNKAPDALVHYKLMIRYTAGANIIYNLNKRFGLVSGLWFSERGTSTNDDVGTGASYNGIPYSKLSIRNSEGYLELPVLLKFSSAASKRLSFYSTAGLVFSTILYEKYRQQDAGTQISYYWGYTIATFQAYRPMYYLATISTGLAYQLNEKTKITVEPNIKYSLNTLYNTTPASPEYHTHEYSVGIRFGVYRSF